MKYSHILVIDNFDSFTYNLVDFFRQLGCSVRVFRNTVPVEQLDREDFDLLVLSPGPSTPRNAGNLMAIIGHFYRNKPILGVCLGHQALVEFFGGSIANIAPVHGKSVPLRHDGRGIFTGIEQGALVARYHSWAAAEIPPELEVSARSADGVVMALRHKKLPIEGIQFHPESVLSMKNNAGMRMLRNAVEGRLAPGNRIYHQLAQALQASTPLDPVLLHAFLQAAEDGQLSDEQKQILLVSLSHQLRNAAELKTFIGVLMEFAALPPRFKGQEAAVDICGTGGSGLPRINTSTLAAFLLAAAGLPIAKHGNRAAAGRFGSFNLLETLGIAATYDPEKATQTLAETGLSFLFAPAIHPVFRHFGPVRNAIGVPSVFNVLGPLVNPFLPQRQFIGTAFEELMDVIFETGIGMGKSHFIVVRGYEGLDEISASAPTRVLEYRHGERFAYDIAPADFGIDPVPFEALSAANPEESTGIARKIIAGLPDTEHYKLVLVNAAFIYSKFKENIPLPEAYRKMEKMMFEGAIQASFEHYQQSIQLVPEAA